MGKYVAHQMDLNFWDYFQLPINLGKFIMIIIINLSKAGLEYHMILICYVLCFAVSEKEQVKEELLDHSIRFELCFLFRIQDTGYLLRLAMTDNYLNQVGKFKICTGYLNQILNCSDLAVHHKLK